MSWADFAHRARTRRSLDPSLIRALPVAALDLPARRPPFSALESERGNLMPTLEDAVQDYLSRAGSLWRERRADRRAPRVAAAI